MDQREDDRLRVNGTEEQKQDDAMQEEFNREIDIILTLLYRKAVVMTGSKVKLYNVRNDSQKMKLTIK